MVMSTALPQDSAEARELSLVGKVELRIALADTDSKLSSVLQTYLAPLLLKLASEHLKVRNKVRWMFGSISIQILIYSKKTACQAARGSTRAVLCYRGFLRLKFHADVGPFVATGHLHMPTR